MAKRPAELKKPDYKGYDDLVQRAANGDETAAYDQEVINGWVERDAAFTYHNGGLMLAEEPPGTVRTEEQKAQHRDGLARDPRSVENLRREQVGRDALHIGIKPQFSEGWSEGVDKPDGTRSR